MREILFRGKVYRKNRRTGEYLDCGWVYGDLHHSYNGNYYTTISNIDSEKMETNDYDVDVCSVSESIGKKDKNDKLIFLGDVVKHKGVKTLSDKDFISVVVWNEKNCCYYLNCHGVLHSITDTRNHEVIDNIYDNKDYVPKKQDYVTWPLDKDLPF